MNTTLVFQPATTFPQIERVLGSLGWVKRPDRAITPPILPGEPEFASWSRTDDTDAEERARISYTFNPVVHLRVLVFYGPRTGARRAEVENALPTLDTAALRELLQSAEPREVLLGILAARELQTVTVLDLLDPLRNHNEPAVARAAQKAYAELVQETLEIGAERLRQEKQRHPERSVLFPRLGDAHMRRQTLRWLIRDYRESNEHIDEVLRSALVDEDWEVRTTAMLAAVRLRAKELWSEIRRPELPKTSRNGPDESDRTILFAARKIALEYLAQGPDGLQMPFNRETIIEDTPTSKEAILQHLRRCMLGLPVTQHDRIFLLINALTEPLEVEGQPPPDSPAIIVHEGTYTLKHAGLELCWIPPVAHWLGTDEKDVPIQNPIRQVTPDSGFFVARFPLSVSLAQQIFSSTQPEDHGDGTDSQKPYLCDWAEAVHSCERLSDLEGVKVCLPTADQWEMAARGTDGRRYPWGNGFEGDPTKFASPWDIEKQVGGAPEWTSTKTRSGEIFICGGEKYLHCTSRTIAPDDNSNVRCAVRTVVRIERSCSAK